ncbi:P-loop containing nucleoside triphosphate hydrolase protein [Fimicolochytrium jonesii]|uniref:P-loop containing nucleoside triphosphate hydrolase protein n=1 Tax=Fimicolochytrium jonesii TaxID=1396493 RepID=UPI0022FF02C4|nr:P-loop containing nucleoside triphosphate hydrolase protein [Fimicolochytrium jonesii]KAI8819089.1 P-loop containing nucleoside triphosphate hydrolase protein [Fimicolochytrium jonesii]
MAPAVASSSTPAAQHVGKRSKKGKKSAAPKPIDKKKLKRDAEEKELKSLEERTTDPSIYVRDESITKFSQLPLSSKTAEGLNKANFVEMTEVQRGTLPHSLCGRDVLGAAKTGSGKTLAFLIPILESLHRAKWTQMDGVGALVISPTRELALQIFEVLKKIGKNHTYSAGLLIGGKDLKSEQDRVNKMNILVCTPGRLLQHMDQTPDFSCDNLRVLVLDEADRVLDMGFERTLNAIVANLPKDRQTLLFSATQTKSVRDLARLSLKDPEYVSVHEQAESATPKQLVQKYLVCNLPDKLDILFSFLKSHLKSKIIVFVSSCKQVRFVHETFCKMQPGIVLNCLHGKQKQAKRMAIFEQFCRKKAICLIATDIAARGLDFPAVDWVIQLDCPEDAATYIHRVGRTARYESEGNGLLFLLPSEEKGMVAALEQKKVPIQRIRVNPSKTTSVVKQLQAYCSQSPEMKYLAQKAFISYMRSVHLQSDKAIFDVNALPAEAYAESLGLPGAPKIKFVKKSEKKNASRQMESMDDAAATKAASDDDEDDVKKQTKVRTKVDKMFDKKNLTIMSDHYAKLVADDSASDDASDSDSGSSASDSEPAPAPSTSLLSLPTDDTDDLLTLARANHDIDDTPEPSLPPTTAPTHRQILKLKEKEIKQRGLGKKLYFDEDGNPIHAFKLETLDEFIEKGDIERRQKEYVEEAGGAVKAADVVDKEEERRKRREKKREKKLKERQARQEESGAATIAGGDYDSDDLQSVQSHYSSYDENAPSEENDDSVSDADSNSDNDDEAMEIDLNEDSDFGGADDSDDEEEEVVVPSGKRKRAEKSLPEPQQPERKASSAKKRRTRLEGADGESLEEIALRLLET